MVLKIPSETDGSGQNNNVSNKQTVSIPLLTIDTANVSQIAIENQSVKADEVYAENAAKPNSETQYIFLLLFT